MLSFAFERAEISYSYSVLGSRSREILEHKRAENFC